MSEDRSLARFRHIAIEGPIGVGKTTLAHLIAERSGAELLLEQPGDYALWAPGVAHRWTIEQDDTVVMTVRWPSRA